MSRVELLSAGGLRVDNRRPYELRSLNFRMITNPVQGTDSGARVEHGLTKVEGYVCGPRDVQDSARSHPTGGALASNNLSTTTSALSANSAAQNPPGSINVVISATPFSSVDRKKITRSDKKFADLALAVQHTFQPVVMLHLYPRSSIDIFIQVIQQDGALLQSAINVTTLALIGAGVSITDYVLSISIGALSTPPTALLDLTNSEQTDLANLTIGVLPRTQKLTLIQLDTRINLTTFQSLLDIGLQACLVLQREIDREVKRWSLALNQATLESLDYHQSFAPVQDHNPQLFPMD